MFFIFLPSDPMMLYGTHALSKTISGCIPLPTAGKDATISGYQKALLHVAQKLRNPRPTIYRQYVPMLSRLRYFS